MPIDDYLPEVETPETPPMLKPKPVLDMNMPSGSEKEEDEMMHSASFELAVRANNFLSGNPVVHQYKRPMENAGGHQHGVDPLFESSRVEKSHRGVVRDPENDHRLKQNKEKDDPSEHVETEREREARQREEANDKRREDEEIRRKKEEYQREKLQEEQRKKVIKLQNTPFGRTAQNNFQPLSNIDSVNEIIFHVAYGPIIRQAMGMSPTFHGLKKVRAMLKNMIAESKDEYVRNELIELNSKVAFLLIDAGVVDV